MSSTIFLCFAVPCFIMFFSLKDNYIIPEPISIVKNYIKRLRRNLTQVNAEGRNAKPRLLRGEILEKRKELSQMWCKPLTNPSKPCIIPREGRGKRDLSESRQACRLISFALSFSTCVQARAFAVTFRTRACVIILLSFRTCFGAGETDSPMTVVMLGVRYSDFGMIFCAFLSLYL